MSTLDKGDKKFFVRYEGELRMYCPRCGAENDKNGMFCCECGMKLAGPKNAVPAPKKKKKRKYIIVIMSVLGVLLLGVTIFINLGKRSENVGVVKQQFLSYLEKHKYEKAYQMLDIEENEWLTEPRFEEMIKDRRISKRDLQVELQNDKKWLFFRKWKISTEGFTAQQVGIAVPAGAVITLGGIEISEKYQDNTYTEKLKDYYVIPELFTGTYQLVITSDFYEEIQKDIELETYNSYIEVSEDMLVFQEEMLTEMREKGKKALEELCTSAVNNRELSSLGLSYQVSASVREDYEAMRWWDYYVINQITFSDFEIVPERPYEENGRTYMETSLKYSGVSQYSPADGSGPMRSNSWTGQSRIKFVWNEEAWEIDTYEEI